MQYFEADNFDLLNILYNIFSSKKFLFTDNILMKENKNSHKV